jgi:hypothetical protein
MQEEWLVLVGWAKKSTSGIMLIILFASLVTFVSNIQLVRTESTPASPPEQEPPAIEWSKNYDWGNDQYAFCIQQTTDGGYVVAGSTNLGSPRVGEALIFKVTSAGAYEWGWSYGWDNSQDYAYSVVQANDGGYVFAGTKSPVGSDPSDIWLFKTNSTGHKQWDATFGDPQREESASCVAKTKDGGYIIAGKTGDLYAPTLYDVVLIKTNGSGILEWSRTFGGVGIDFAESVQQTFDEGYIVAGTSNSHGSSTNAWLIKTDDNGILERDQVYGGSDSLEQFSSVKQTDDEGYIAVGYTNSSGVSNDFWLVRVNSTLGTVWSRTYGGLDDDYGVSFDKTSDGGYILAGSTYSSVDTSPDFLVVKTDINGNSDWSQIYGTDDTDQAHSVIETKDGGYIVAGYTYYYSGGVSTDPYLVKIVGDTDKDGLADSWERRGVDYNKDGFIDLNLSSMGADWKHKDLFVEVDYMGSDGTHDHKPDAEAIEQVKAAFKNAPVKNPDNKDGITLHVEISDEIPHQNTFKFWDDFDSIKSSYFGNKTQREGGDSYNVLHAKALVYRYCLFIHLQAWFNSTSNKWETDYSSGVAEDTPGNDFIVSLGDFTGGKGTVDEQAGTFMHELGHALGLKHGGGDNVNYKPNYLSIMNYAFQLPDLNPNRPLDYSRVKLPDLDETHLDENKGVGAEVAGQPLMTVFSNRWGNASILSAAFLPIDWNQNGNSTEVDVSANINNFRKWDSGNAGDELLTGYNDWDNIVYNFRDLDNFGEGVHGAERMEELTWDVVQQMREAANSAHDVAILNLNTPQPVVSIGSSLDLNVTVMNQGGSSEALHVTVYANSTPIASKDLALDSWNITTLNLTGAISGFSEGSYLLSAYVAPVANESDIGDNTYNYGFLTVSSEGGGWVEWSQSYAKNVGDVKYHDVAYSVCQTADGGFAVAGETGSYGDFWLVKTYPNGSMQWDKTYTSGSGETAGYYSDGAYSIQETSEGGFILAGYARAPTKKNTLWLVKTDSEGIVLWNKTYAANSSYWSGDQWAVRQASDGGYIAAGDRMSYSTSIGDQYEMWLIRTDSAGRELWNKTYGGPFEHAYSVWQTADGGYILGGSTYSIGTNYFGALLVKTDALGNQQWNKTWINARIYSLQQTTDGGYILAGSMYYSGSNDYGDFWLAKTDPSGITQWNKTYTCTRLPDCEREEAYSAQQTMDGGYVIAGYALSSGPSSYDVWIVKTDGNGNVQTDLTYGMGRMDIAYSVVEAQDGGYVVAGSTEPAEHASTNDFLLVKFRILIVVPDFPEWMLLPFLMLLTLVIALLSKKRTRFSI